MKKFVFATAIVLLSSLGVAQNSASPEQTPDKQQLAELEKHGKAVEGCLTSEGADTFTLTNAKGRPYKLTGDTSGLKENAGHKVILYGTAANSGYDPTSIWGSQATFGVKRVESLADTCK